MTEEEMMMRMMGFGGFDSTKVQADTAALPPMCGQSEGPEVLTKRPKNELRVCRARL